MKKLIAIILAAVILFSLSGCASLQRMVVDFQSEIKNGLDRTINVYTANGEIIVTYKGKIDIEANDGWYVKFDFNGKRYVYYNCFVESIADIS